MSSLTTTVSLKDLKLPIFLFVIFELAVFAAAIYEESPFLIIAGIVALAVVVWSFFSVQKTFYLFALYISILPSYASYLRYPYLKMWVLLEVIAALLLLMFLYDFSHRIFQRQKLFFQRMTIMDKAFIVFLVWTIFSALWGLVYGGDPKYVYTELFFFSLYIAYFIIRRNFETEESLHKLWLIFNVIAVIVSLEYIYIAFIETGLGTGILIKRVSTQQPHLAQLAFPYLLSYFLFKSKTANKKLVVVGLVPLFLMIFFSQQRGLWVGIVFSVLVLWALSFIREGVSFKNFIKFTFFLLMAVGFITGLGLFIDKFFLGSTILTMIERFNTLLELAKDESLLIRVGEMSNAIDQWKLSPLFGTGLGSTINPVILEHYPNNIVDNSYTVFMWKGGIIGLLIYLFMMLLFFVRALYIFKNTHDVQRQRAVAALISGYGGLLVIALTNSCVAYYRYNVFWAMAYATIETLYWREKQIQQAA